ncbi:MAG: DUF5644 domain-containing protein [Helicobacteraceae bacterium]|nr:DUF5644 domain-containing protein [Helicobacteraceae bacterium]
MKIEARIFRFNAKHDYLGVYHPFIYQANGESTLLDLLYAYKQSEPLCSMPLEKIEGVKANGVGAKITAPLSSFVKKRGDAIEIAPLALERAAWDLYCDRNDFEEKLGVLEEFCDKGDRDYYYEFYIPYAVSPMRSLNADYLGEALFMLADRLISKNPLNADAILRRISRAEDGIFCFAGLNGVLLEGAAHIAMAIEGLQELSISGGYAPKNAKSAKYAAIDYDKTPKLTGKKTAIATDCGAFGVLPKIDEYEAVLRQNGADILRLANPSRFSGAGVADLAPQIAFKAANDLILEAQDLGADTLLCASSETQSFLTKNIKSIERVGGYPIHIEIAAIE